MSFLIPEYECEADVLPSDDDIHACVFANKRGLIIIIIYLFIPVFFVLSEMYASPHDTVSLKETFY